MLPTHRRPIKRQPQEQGLKRAKPAVDQTGNAARQSARQRAPVKSQIVCQDQGWEVVVLERVPAQLFSRRYLFIIHNKRYCLAMSDSYRPRPPVNRRALDAALQLLATELMPDNDDLGKPFQPERTQQRIACARDEGRAINEQLHSDAVEASRDKGTRLFKQRRNPVGSGQSYFQDRLAGR